MENGVLELDVAATEATNFLGLAFGAASPRFSNVVFLRPGASGTEEAVQYGPAFNSVGVAWQVYHGEGANAVAELPRDRWTSIPGSTSRTPIWKRAPGRRCGSRWRGPRPDGASEPCLVVNDLKQGDRAGRIALWAHVTTDAYFGPISVTPR